MKQYFYLTWVGLLLGCHSVVAQVSAATGSGTLSGTVLDSVSRQPVAYATVVLLPPAPAETPITGAAADEKGQFKLSQLPAGALRLRVLFVGYASRTRPVTVGAGPTNLGVVLLPPTTQKLGEVVVTGTKPVIEVKPDRLVYNADQDISNAGGTAQDVLRKAPMLAVDGDGNVTMRGSANFRVLVNNRPAPTLAKNLAEALANIPAAQIQSVEIITTPPAQYDGEGTAGIINIVLKKGTEQGANGQLGASSGNRDTRLRASLNYRKGKLNFTSLLSAGALYRPGGSDLTRLGYGSLGTDTLRRQGSRRFRQHSIYSTAGVDYTINEHQTFSLTGVVDYYNVHTLSDLLTTYAAPTPASNYLFARTTDEPITGFDAELTAAYTHTFARPRQEWSALAQVSASPSTYGYDFQQFDNSAVTLADQLASYRERSRGRNPSREATLQTDFTQPLGERSKLEVGLKAIFRSTSSVATIDTLHTRYAPSAAEDPRRATDFSYDQQVQAAYASYGFAVGPKLTASLGSRLERTGIQGDFRTSATGFERAYFTPLPNGFVQYSLGEASSVRTAYSRRINRPYIAYINPFVDRSQPGIISYGNPMLDPELTNSYELSYNNTFKTATLNAAFSVRHTGNAIEEVRLPTADPGVVASTYANVAAATFYQFNVSAAFKPQPGWDLSLGPDVQYLVLRSPSLPAEQRGLTAALTANTSYKLPRSYTVQSFFYGSLPTPQIQGRTWASPYYSVGLKKSFWQDRADLTFNLSCLFSPNWAVHTTTATPYFDQTSIAYQQGQRSFRFSFAYRFGQQAAGRERKAIDNDDTKPSSKGEG